MTLLIAYFLIYGLKLHWSWYVITGAVWLLKQSDSRVSVYQNINQEIHEDGDSTHGEAGK